MRPVRGRLLIGFGALIGGLIALHQTSTSGAASSYPGQTPEVRLMTLDPGHFHAALVQKEMYPGVSRQVYVYAPLGQDLVDHLARIARYNNRQQSPTAWELVVKAAPDSLQRMLRERPGNVVVISGRNRGKIDLIDASVNAGLSVLADKPWALNTADLPKLEAALNAARQRGLIAYDIMTERYEITTMLQKELVNDVSIFGKIVPGAAQDPGVYMESVHYLLKTVSGVPNLRPAWFFDVEQQGEGMNDVGTHLVDLVPWILFPEQPIDYRREIDMLSARRWATLISKADFRRVTGEDEFPTYLLPNVKGAGLSLFDNTEALYRLKGVNVRLRALWSYEPPPGGGDTHYAVFRGTRSRVEVRQAKEPSQTPQLYVAPNGASQKTAVLAALRKKVEVLQSKYPGVTVEDLGAELRLLIPARYRDGHESHFAAVTRQFLAYWADPKSFPAWERSNMMAKYYVTTTAVEMSRRSSSGS